MHSLFRVINAVLLPHIIECLYTHSVTDCLIRKHPNERAPFEIVAEDCNYQCPLLGFADTHAVDLNEVKPQIQADILAIRIYDFIEVPHLRQLIEARSVDDSHEVVEENRNLGIVKSISVKIRNALPQPPRHRLVLKPTCLLSGVGVDNAPAWLRKRWLLIIGRALIIHSLINMHPSGITIISQALVHLRVVSVSI